MIYRLTKYSYSNTWQKDFYTEREARFELSQHICKICLAKEGEDEWGYECEPVDINDIQSLLSTSCGCEFGLEEIWEDFA